jgi:cell division control protein 12
LGKTTYINTLFATTLKQQKSPSKRHEKQLEKTVDIEITKAGKKKQLLSLFF